MTPPDIAQILAMARKDASKRALPPSALDQTNPLGFRDYGAPVRSARDSPNYVVSSLANAEMFDPPAPQAPRDLSRLSAQDKARNRQYYGKPGPNALATPPAKNEPSFKSVKYREPFRADQGGGFRVDEEPAPMPVSDPSAVTAPSPMAPPAGGGYSVKAGDTLSGIAGGMLGPGASMQEIMQLAAQLQKQLGLEDPRKLGVGTNIAGAQANLQTRRFPSKKSTTPQSAPVVSGEKKMPGRPTRSFDDRPNFSL